jgi:hypothetical protein
VIAFASDSARRNLADSSIVPIFSRIGSLPAWENSGPG